MRSYLLASLALGVVATWASENLFWTAPPTHWSPLDFALTVAVYCLCAAAALSVVLATGVQGWVAAFLGGAVLGWLVEGVVVATMYEAFPFQLVWTPLAWHAVVTGLVVIGLGRMAARLSAVRLVVAWLGVGLLGGAWAAYWPIERHPLPDAGTVAVYLVGLGCLVPLANLLLDRLARVGPVPRPVLWTAPTALTAWWLIRVVSSPSVTHAALPLLLLAAWWIMRRLGTGSGEGLGLGAPSSPARHALFLLAPALTATIAAVAWRAAPEGLGVNVPIAFGLSGVGLVLAGLLGFRAIRRRPVVTT